MKLKASKLVCSFIAGMLLFCASCSKSDTNTSASMSATVAGNGITFSTTISGSGGVTVLQGTNSRYTVTLYFKTLAQTVFTFADPSTGYYATVTDNLGNSYSTDAANTGQATLTASGTKYNGTFYFTANETSPSPGGGNVVVTNGSFSNL
jgi:hypothetical protein